MNSWLNNKYPDGKRVRTRRATNSQFEALVAGLEANPFLVHKKDFQLPHRRRIFAQGWKDLADHLNAVPNGAIKTSDQWMTVWRDVKSRAVKAARLSKDKSNGKASVTSNQLVELDRRVVTLVGGDYGNNNRDSDQMMVDNDPESLAENETVDNSATNAETSRTSSPPVPTEASSSLSPKYATGNMEETPKKRKRTCKATNRQFEELLSRLEANPFLVYKKDLHILKRREIFDEGWKEIAEHLNAIPNGAVKTSDQWMTVWRDVKSRASIKAARLSMDKNKSGKLQVTSNPLTEIERRALNVIGVGTNHDGYSDSDWSDDDQDPLAEEENADISAPNATSRKEASSNIHPRSSRDKRARSNLSDTHNDNSSESHDSESEAYAEVLEFAKTDFLTIAASQADSMKVLATAAKLQAEAAKKQADSMAVFAEAAKKLTDVLDGFLKRQLT